MLLQVKRWLLDREIIAVGNSSYAVIDLLAALTGKVSIITRLRLDAALYEPVPLRKAGQVGRSRKKGKHLPTLQQLAESPDMANIYLFPLVWPEAKVYADSYRYSPMVSFRKTGCSYPVGIVA